MTKLGDLTGQKLGRWLVLEYRECFNKPPSHHRWLCQCDCGTVREVQDHTLRHGISKSCGCTRDKKLKTHGLSRSKIHNSWRAMKERCENTKNKRYSSYGGRGITYDLKWKTFDGFYEDMGDSHVDGLELDRIDVNGNYCKENCRWADQAEQCYNQRLRKDNKTGRTGVWFNKKTGKYLAYIRFKNKRINLGYYSNFEDAVKVREEAEIEYYGYNRE